MFNPDLFGFYGQEGDTTFSTILKEHEDPFIEHVYDEAAEEKRILNYKVYLDQNQKKMNQKKEKKRQKKKKQIEFLD